jgi:integrase
MAKLNLLLENEKKSRYIDEKDYKRRLLLQRCIDSYIEYNGSKRPVLIKEQQIVLKEYFNDLLAKNRLKATSINNQIVQLYYLSHQINKPYSKITEKDLKEFFAKQHGISINSLILKQCFVKQFFTWLGKEEVISWIKFSKRKPRNITSQELLTEEEIKKIVQACPSPRDKCIVMLLYEGALRRGEIANIKVKDLTETEIGLKIIVDGKTGSRTILFIDSIPYIKDWLNNHQYINELNAPLFYSFARSDYGRTLQHEGIYIVLKNAVNIAEIKKKVFPHLLRHSRLDELGRQGFRERDLKIFAGWSKESNMANVYLHYGEEEVERKLLEQKGIIQQRDTTVKTILQSLKCDKCNTLNTPTAVYCNCGEMLKKGKREEYDGVLNKLFENKEFIEIIRKILNGGKSDENILQ